MKKGFLKTLAPVALVAILGAAVASAAPRGGFGGHGFSGGGHGFSAGGHSFSGGYSAPGGRAYAAPNAYGGRSYGGYGYGGHGYGGYVGPSFGIGFGVGAYPYAYVPYGYAPYDYAPYGYSAPAPCAAPSCAGYYDQNGAWQPSPDCAAPAPQVAPMELPPQAVPDVPYAN